VRREQFEPERLYPEIEPYDHGLLEVGDDHRVYWEACGEPGGKPAVVLHGGPGSGCTRWWRRLFDPQAYRVVLFDQRGCGRSTPHAGAATADLAANTTYDLVEDVERLRRHLGIERWLVLGGSWGSTLGLAYAQAHSDAVSEMVLFSVVTTTRREVEWVTPPTRARHSPKPCNGSGTIARASRRTDVRARVGSATAEAIRRVPEPASNRASVIAPRTPPSG
jgi:proline iminopeptidase